MINHQATWATVAVLAAAVVLLASCTSPQVTRRYVSAEFPTGETVSDDVALSLFSMDVPVPSAQTAVLNFDARAQAALIQALSAKVTDAPSLLNALASPIAPLKPPQMILDRTVVERRVIMSIDHRSSEPSTRLHKAAVVLSLKAPADFKSWSGFATKYETVNLGSVRFTQGSEFGIGVKAAAPQLPTVGVDGRATATRSLEENLGIEQRFVGTTGVLTPKTARLIQEGAFGRDLTGNMIVDLTVSVESPAPPIDLFTFARLFDAAGKPNPAGTIAIDKQTVIFVSSACQPVQATAQLKATLRRVQAGGQTLIEGDDTAVYQPVTTRDVGFDLVPAEALRFSAWALADSRNTDRQLHIETGTGQQEVLYFGSFDEANDLLLYVRALPGDGPLSVGGLGLWLGSQRLLKSDLRGLQAAVQRLNWAECPSPGILQPSSRQTLLGKSADQPR